MGRTMRQTSRTRSAVFAPLGDSGRAARVEQRLAEAIGSGLLSDGERLPSETELAALFGVAPVTAREALIALRARGLVTTVRGRGGGSFVTRPQQPADGFLSARLAAMSRVELRDRGTVYRIMLAGCAELAAQRADPSDVADLEDLLVPAEVEDITHWRHADSELYLSLAALTQSARVTQEVVRLEAEFGGLLRLPFADKEFRAGAARRHALLVQAIGSRDSDAARTHVQDHVDEALARLVEKHAEVQA